MRASTPHRRCRKTHLGSWRRGNRWNRQCPKTRKQSLTRTTLEQRAKGAAEWLTSSSCFQAKTETMKIERSLGRQILQNTTKTRVNLKTPRKTFIGILTSGKLVFGIKLAEAQIKTFSERRPRKKPFFHPSD